MTKVRSITKLYFTLQDGPKKWVTGSWPQFSQILTAYKIFSGRFLGKFVLKWILTIPPQLAFVATLPCEILMSAKQGINDKLQGSVTAYLRCGCVVNNQIKKGLGLLLSLWVKFLNRWICGKVTSKNVIVSCTFFVFLPRDAMHTRYMLWPCVCVCLSVSVTSWITQTKPYDSSATLVFGCQRSPRNSTGVASYGGAKCRPVG